VDVGAGLGEGVGVEELVVPPPVVPHATSTSNKRLQTARKIADFLYRFTNIYLLLIKSEREVLYETLISMSLR
jgi:hypothetical protein